MTGPRPAGVTLVAILTWLTGLFQIIPGVILLVGNPAETTTTAAAWTAIIIGVIVMIVGTGLLRGSKLARVLVTISFLLSIASAILVSIAAPQHVWATVPTFIFAAVGLFLLYSRRASNFFN